MIDLDVLDCDASVILKDMSAMKIPCYGIQWPEAYMEAAYRDHNGFGAHKFPFESKEFTNPESVNYKDNFCETANSLRKQTVSLFLHPTWEEVHIQRCIDGLLATIKKHVK
ncbi:MAG TPA: hypothetical protein DDZ89_19255 [Clostridiales bacterium]|nr:hypothetical protein [Clostridiales bacterium]